jgi:exonuclease SbcD
MLDGFEDATTWHALYADRVHVVEEALARGLLEGYDASRDVAIFAAHLHVGGAVLSGSERRVHVGDTYASHLEHIPAVSYAAFGHIHKPQTLPGSVLNGTYAGSPLQLDFGEVREEKRVVLVDARPGQPARVTSIPLRAGRPLWRFDGTLDELAVRAPQAGRCLALVTMHTDTTTPGLHLQVQDRLPDAVLLQVTEVPADRKLPALAGADAGGGPEPEIDELFRDYLTEVGTRGAAADRVMATFATLLEAVESEQLVHFPEEDDLRAPVGVSIGAGVDIAVGTTPPLLAQGAPAPSASARTISCRQCGRSFEAPVKRGRPPTVCPECR